MYKSHIRIDAVISLWASCKSWFEFNFCNQVASSFKKQRGSGSFEHAVVESLSIVMVCYHNNYSRDCVFPYFPTEQVDASRQSSPVTDLL